MRRSRISDRWDPRRVSRCDPEASDSLHSERVSKTEMLEGQCRS